MLWYLRHKERLLIHVRIACIRQNTIAESFIHMIFRLIISLFHYMLISEHNPHNLRHVIHEFERQVLLDVIVCGGQGVIYIFDAFF